jgi:broad specificity phosphatase PhoE
VGVEIVYETHATSTDNEAGIATGWLGGEFSATGGRQALELGERRSRTGLAVVFTSDLAPPRSRLPAAIFRSAATSGCASATTAG